MEDFSKVVATLGIPILLFFIAQIAVVFFIGGGSSSRLRRNTKLQLVGARDRPCGSRISLRGRVDTHSFRIRPPSDVDSFSSYRVASCGGARTLAGLNRRAEQAGDGKPFPVSSRLTSVARFRILHTRPRPRIGLPLLKRSLKECDTLPSWRISSIRLRPPNEFRQSTARTDAAVSPSAFSWFSSARQTSGASSGIRGQLELPRMSEPEHPNQRTRRGTSTSLSLSVCVSFFFNSETLSVSLLIDYSFRSVCALWRSAEK